MIVLDRKRRCTAKLFSRWPDSRRPDARDVRVQISWSALWWEPPLSAHPRKVRRESRVLPFLRKCENQQHVLRLPTLSIRAVQDHIVPLGHRPMRRLVCSPTCLFLTLFHHFAPSCQAVAMLGFLSPPSPHRDLGAHRRTAFSLAALPLTGRELRCQSTSPVWPAQPINHRRTLMAQSAP